MLRGIFALGLAILGYMATPAIANEDIFQDNKNIKLKYMMYCAECHSRSAEGSTEGPSLLNSKIIKSMDLNKLKNIIAKGMPLANSIYPKGQYREEMPGFSIYLEKAEIKSLAKLVKGWNQ
jgi:mono/diheme cytochrome c family protein